MVATITRNDTAAGEKLLQYYLSGVEKPTSEYIATAVLAVIDEMEATAPEAFSGMVSYLSDVKTGLEESVVNQALKIIENKIIEQQTSIQNPPPSLEKQFTAELLKRTMTAISL
jgi:hypothetical protein